MATKAITLPQEVKVLDHVPALYNTLPTLFNANNESKEKDASGIMDNLLGPVFVKHNMEDIFNACLLHNHFAMEDNERLIAFGNVSVPVETAIDIGSKVWDLCWRFQDDSHNGEEGVRMGAYEFIEFPLGQHGGIDLKEEKYQPFLKAVYKVLKENGLINIIGICLREKAGERTIDGRPVFRMEYTAGRANIVAILDKLGESDKSFEAMWSFCHAGTDPYKNMKKLIEPAPTECPKCDHKYEVGDPKIKKEEEKLPKAADGCQDPECLKYGTKHPGWDSSMPQRGAPCIIPDCLEHGVTANGCSEDPGCGLCARREARTAALLNAKSILKKNAPSTTPCNNPHCSERTAPGSILKNAKPAIQFSAPRPAVALRGGATAEVEPKVDMNLVRGCRRYCCITRGEHICGSMHGHTNKPEEEGINLRGGVSEEVDEPVEKLAAGYCQVTSNGGHLRYNDGTPPYRPDEPASISGGVSQEVDEPVQKLAAGYCQVTSDGRHMRYNDGTPPYRPEEPISIRGGVSRELDEPLQKLAAGYCQVTSNGRHMRYNDGTPRFPPEQPASMRGGQTTEFEEPVHKVAAGYCQVTANGGYMRYNDGTPPYLPEEPSTPIRGGKVAEERKSGMIITGYCVRNMDGTHFRFGDSSPRSLHGTDVSMRGGAGEDAEHFVETPKVGKQAAQYCLTTPDEKHHKGDTLAGSKGDFPDSGIKTKPSTSGTQTTSFPSTGPTKSVSFTAQTGGLPASRIAKLLSEFETRIGQEVAYSITQNQAQPGPKIDNSWRQTLKGQSVPLALRGGADDIADSPNGLSGAAGADAKQASRFCLKDRTGDFHSVIFSLADINALLPAATRGVRGDAAGGDVPKVNTRVSGYCYLDKNYKHTGKGGNLATQPTIPFQSLRGGAGAGGEQTMPKVTTKVSGYCYLDKD